MQDWRYFVSWYVKFLKEHSHDNLSYFGHEQKFNKTWKFKSTKIEKHQRDNNKP